MRIRNNHSKELSLDFETSATGIISLILLGIYLIHLYIIYSRHTELIEIPETAQRFESLPSGTTWIFLLTTIGLPLFCSIIANWVTSPIVIPIGASVSGHLKIPFYNLAISVFVLMITIEIGYLYNDNTTKWRAYIVAALIIDLMALLTFLVIVKPPTNLDEGYTILFFIMVSLGSLISSCATIYYAKIHSVIGSN
jgi:hypothetical protein